MEGAFVNFATTRHQALFVAKCRLDLGLLSFFLRSAHRFFIRRDSFLRPAALILPACLVLAAVFATAGLACLRGCLLELDPLRILRADVSLANRLRPLDGPTVHRCKHRGGRTTKRRGRPLGNHQLGDGGAFFGLNLFKAMHEPVDLIHSSWGGTPAESWTTLSTLQSAPAFADILD